MVTRGTRPWVAYASVPCFETATKLRDIAILRGYRRPLVLELREYERLRDEYRSQQYHQNMQHRLKYLEEHFGPDYVRDLQSRRRSANASSPQNGYSGLSCRSRRGRPCP